MLGLLRALRSWKDDAPGQDQALLRWAREQRFVIKRVRDGSGLVVLGASHGLGELPWRLEWGASQRTYIGGAELRMRMELGLPKDMHAMVLSERLRERLEAQTFEDWTNSNRTLVAQQTPEETRWVALYPTVKAFRAQRLARRMSLFCPQEDLARTWMSPAFESALLMACDSLLEGDAPFIVMLLRGRLYLRVQCAEPELRLLKAAVEVLEAAAQSASKAASAWTSSHSGRSHSAGESSWLTSGLSTWNSELPPPGLSTLPMATPAEDSSKKRR
jgi:hypothetical protein